ncbi:MAG: branched-chain amino acid ABC transporter permease [Desulfatiglandales bacterium]|jgi:branched-chain amino acid transport system permease protein
MDAYIEQLPQQMVQGLSLGGIYALIAVGYTMVYAVLFMLNFAHGEIYMIGGFAGWWTLSLLTRNQWPLINGFVLIFFMIVMAIMVAACVGMTVERIAYRPLRKSPRINLLLSALGVSLFLQYAVLTFQGPEPRFLSSYALIPESVRIFYMGGVVISFIRVLVMVISFVFLALILVFIKTTRAGKAMRATAQDREAATLMGIDTDRIIVLVFLIGSALGGAAGTLAGLLFTQLDYASGLQAGLKGFTAAVLGGMGSVSGALMGGIILGLIEEAATLFIPAAYRDAVAFAVLVLVLIFRPRGLMGEKIVEKV